MNSTCDQKWASLTISGDFSTLILWESEVNIWFNSYDSYVNIEILSTP